jgi:hypothetical protein
MSHPTGAYLGGVRSLEDLRSRCRIDEHTDCWHCSLAFNQGTVRIWVHLGGGMRKMMRGRRAALFLARGKDLPPKHLAWGLKHCKSLDCVNPAHCASGTKAQWGAALSAKGTVKNRPTKIRAARESSLCRRVLTDAQAYYVRHSDKTLAELAAELKVSRTLISEIRRGNRYTEVFRGASVFAWRPPVREAA